MKHLIKHKQYVRLYKLLFIIAVLGSLCMQNSTAQMRVIKLDEALHRADVIVQGVITHADISRYGGTATAVVSKVYRGNIQDTFLINWEWEVSGDDRGNSITKPGNSYLFLMMREQEEHVYIGRELWYFKIEEFHSSDFLKESYADKNKVRNLIEQSERIEAMYCWQYPSYASPATDTMVAIVENTTYKYSIVLPIPLLEEYLHTLQTTSEEHK